MRHRGRALGKRYGRAIRPIFSVASSGHRLESFKMKGKAIEFAKDLEGRGYTPYVYEFIEGRPERHRLIVYGPGTGTVAPPYTGR